MPVGVRSGCESTCGCCSAHPPCRYVPSVAMFRLQGTRVLAVDMTGDAVKAKNGSMVAYDGQMSFRKLTGGGEGLRGMVT
ncbi:AIM24 family protein, partial [Streptomyces althioticus]